MVGQQMSDVRIREVCEGRVAELDARYQRGYYPSPAAWEDEVLYFLLLDRFSDGNEQGYDDNDGQTVTGGTTPRFAPGDRENAVQTPTDAQQWCDAGRRWVGGNLDGLRSKMGYLKRMGITALWVSPVFRQVRYHDTYHGYGIQNFLDIDPHFGTRESLKAMVDAAHEHGIRVILDIILNHAGDVFSYNPDRHLTTAPDGTQYLDPRWDGRPYAVAGFHDAQGRPTLPFGRIDLGLHPEAWPDGAVWPAELQDPGTFTCRGHITNWDWWPEYAEGDFCDLKDFHQGENAADGYRPSPGLRVLCEAYKFWIAYADVDGFRVDTVKHMDEGATRYMASVIHEFAVSIGKENFYLIGEITGGRERAMHVLGKTGLNAALGIDDIPDRMAYLVKGYRNPSEYFGLFRNSLLVGRGSHTWFRDRVVTMVDDHDQVYRGGNKARFCAREAGHKVVLNALALNATTLGIPCVYYGTEQSFDGQGGDDRYLREAMFGGAFGPFRSKGRHCFNEESPVYRELAKVLAVRRRLVALRRGRQYLREISGNGVDFGLPQMFGSEIRSVVPWSRILDDREVLCAINTDYDKAQTAWVTIDSSLHRTGDDFTCAYSTDLAQIGRKIPVVARNGGALPLTVPPAGFVIYE